MNRESRRAEKILFLVNTINVLTTKFIQIVDQVLREGRYIIGIQNKIEKFAIAVNQFFGKWQTKVILYMTGVVNEVFPLLYFPFATD